MSVVQMPLFENRIRESCQAAKEKADKASDLDIIVSEIMKLPYGQLKKVPTDDVLAVLAKYGVV